MPPITRLIAATRPARTPISVEEFGQKLRACRPPTGWGNALAVAHSGGADSTCLLYLLHKWLEYQKKGGEESEIPRKLLSLSVDHSLQPGSLITAKKSYEFSQSLDIQSHIICIPWSQPPYPDRPEPGDALEDLARQARYRLLFDAMSIHNASVIATGHQADDQVETLLMRLYRTLKSRPSGMRRCRRWGMGTRGELDKGDLKRIGGMGRWVIKPLLEFPKERILATCEAHGLPYIDDPTNSDPYLTQRNFIRHCLSGEPITRASTRHDTWLYDRRIVEKAIGVLDSTNRTLNGLPYHMAGLYDAARYLSWEQDLLDEEATKYIKANSLSSPPSTLLLREKFDCPSLSTDLKRAIILRILRFISPNPWGSPTSESLRNSASLDRISARLFTNIDDKSTSFMAGSDVLWSPVFIRDKKLVLVSDYSRAWTYQPGDDRGWMVSRAKPMRWRKDACIRDVTPFLNTDRKLKILWDNRFVVTMNPWRLYQEILESCRSGGSVKVVAYGRWSLPQVIWTRPKQEVWTLPGPGTTLMRGVGMKGEEIIGGLGKEPYSGLNPSWVNFHFIRSLDAI